MGVSANVYTGFFIKLNKTVLIKKTEVDACLNEECDEFHIEAKSKFCGGCGSKIEKVFIEEKLNLKGGEYYTHDIVTGKYENIVSFNSYVPNILKPEIKLPCSKSGDIMYESLVFEFSFREIEKAKIEIENNSKLTSVIKYLNDTYGEGTAELSYGVVAYAS